MLGTQGRHAPPTPPPNKEPAVARKPLIAGNWKLNLGPGAARATAALMARDLAPLAAQVDFALFPTALSVAAVVEAVGEAPIGVGVQEVAAKVSGAVTGANSAVMAREAGCTWMLAGHSERRQLFGETDEGVRDKLRLGLDAGLLPILCIGETLAEREAGQVTAVTERQLAVALEPLREADMARVTIAYEPVWAIGTGRTASPAQAQEVHAALRAWLRQRFSPAVADATRILYGGSVKPDNAAELLAQPDLDGALVGGASLRAGTFLDIARAAL